MVDSLSPQAKHTGRDRLVEILRVVMIVSLVVLAVLIAIAGAIESHKPQGKLAYYEIDPSGSASASSDPLIEAMQNPQISDLTLLFVDDPGFRDRALAHLVDRTERDRQSIEDAALAALGPQSGRDFVGRIRDLLHRGDYREHALARWYVVHPETAKVALGRCDARVYLDWICQQAYLGALVAGVVPIDYDSVDLESTEWKAAVAAARSRASIAHYEDNRG